MTRVVGITFDLRDEYRSRGYGEEEIAEFDRPETIDAIDRALSRLRYRTDRIGSIQALTRRLAAGDRWDLVFNFAEGLHGFGRESQVPALLDAYEIPYTFSDPLTLALSLHKGMAKHVVRDLGVPTPDFVVLEREEDVERVELEPPLFVKPVATGSSMGVADASRVDDPAALRRRCAELLRRFGQPVLVESFLAGREMTVGVVGTGDRARVLGVMEVLARPSADRHAYTFENKARYTERISYALVNGEAAVEAERLALQSWRGLGGRDLGRVDLRADREGRLHFLEVNPLPGLHPVDADIVILSRLLSLPYHRLIEMVLDSAAERVSGVGPPALTHALPPVGR